MDKLGAFNFLLYVATPLAPFVSMKELYHYCMVHNCRITHQHSSFHKQGIGTFQRASLKNKSIVVNYLLSALRQSSELQSQRIKDMCQ